MEEEIKKDRERIKIMIKESLVEARRKRTIRIGEVRLDHLIGCMFWNIDNPDYVRKI